MLLSLHLISRVPGHHTSIRHTGWDHRLGPGDKTGVIEDQDDRVIRGVGEAVSQKHFCTRTQKNPSLSFCLLSSSFSTKMCVFYIEEKSIPWLWPKAPKRCLESWPVLSPECRYDQTITISLRKKFLPVTKMLRNSNFILFRPEAESRYDTLKWGFYHCQHFILTN